MKIGPLEVGGNVWCLGWLYVSWAHTDGGGWPVQRTWVNEPEEPWRYGRGLGLRLPFHRMATMGFWRRQDIGLLIERVHEDIAATEAIEQWDVWDQPVSA